MIMSLLVPIIISAIGLFILSAISWTASPLHEPDWKKIPEEDKFMQAVRDSGMARGESYMFPRAANKTDQGSEAFVAKYKEGPVGIVTVMPDVNMGKNLGQTFCLFLIVSFMLAYLGTIGLKPGSAAVDVFRFYFTAGILTFLTGITQHSIWFKNRITGHIIESIIYAAFVAAVFTFLWPKA